MEDVKDSLRPLLAGLLAGLVGGIMLIDVLLPSQFATGMICFGLVLFSYASRNKAFTIFSASACSLILILDVAVIPESTALPERLVVFERGLAILATWLAAVLAILPSPNAYARHSLRGSLIICAGCKNIRDYYGAWLDLERYIRRSQGLKIRPSVCPFCRVRETAPAPATPVELEEPCVLH
jgi:hypothetical protein